MIVNHRWTSWNFYTSKLPKWAKCNPNLASQSTLRQQKLEVSRNLQAVLHRLRCGVWLSWHDMKGAGKRWRCLPLSFDTNWTFELIADLVIFQIFLCKNAMFCSYVCLMHSSSLEWRCHKPSDGLDWCRPYRLQKTGWAAECWSNLWANQKCKLDEKAG